MQQPVNTSELFPHEPVPPDLLAWARQTFDEREYQEGVRDIEATGGRTFDELVAEVEARMRGHE